MIAEGDVVATLDAPGLACVSLQPLVKTRLADLAPGDRLAVRTDDPAARVGMPAWCRLSGHRLVRVTEHDATTTTFVVEHR